MQRGRRLKKVKKEEKKTTKIVSSFIDESCDVVAVARPVEWNGSVHELKWNARTVKRTPSVAEKSKPKTCNTDIERARS